MINFGNWQDLEKLQAQAAYQNPHQNAFGGMLRALDPMTYVPGLNVVANAAHDVGGEVVTGLNTVLSPVVKTTNNILKTVSPGVQYLEDNTMMGGINDFVENKPADALALAAATFFSGGAAAKAMSPAVASAAPAASVAGGSGGMASAGAAGSAAITPAFSSGAAAGSGAGVGMAGSTTGTLAGISGTGTLGTAGTAAANSALTPGFASMGTGMGLMGQVKPYFDAARSANSYKNNFSKFAGRDSQKQDATDKANAFARTIIDTNTPPDTRRKKVTDQMTINRFGAV